MTVKHILFQTCQFIVLLKLVQNYVLFAANLDDFRSMAKKFIPDHLADQITDMASQQKHYRQSKHTRDPKDHLNEYIDRIKTGVIKVIKPSDTRVPDTLEKKHVKDNVQAIDFEELVDRVRQKIQAESVDNHDTRNRHKQEDDIDDTEKNVRDSHKDKEYDYEETEKIQIDSTTRREREFSEESNREHNYNEKPRQPKTASKTNKQEYYYDTPDLPFQNDKNQPAAATKSSKQEYYYDAPELPRQNDKKQPEAATKSSKQEYYYDETELPRQNYKKRPEGPNKSSKQEYYYEAPELPGQNDKERPEATTKSSKQEYYYDAPDPPIQNIKKHPQVTTSKQDDNMFFHEANLANTNDSYEDYVTPKRDAVFESDSETITSRSVLTREKLKSDDQRFKTVKPKTESQNKPLSQYSEQKRDQYEEVGDTVKHDEVKEYRDVNHDNEELGAAIPLAEDDDYYTEHKLEEVKAKTESLGNEPTQKGGTMKKLKGTMIPTRQRFKMSSPNYLQKIPVVAEKYDFNEPLPERDREPENLKHLPNPPARINQKVRLRGDI